MTPAEREVFWREEALGFRRREVEALERQAAKRRGLFGRDLR